MMTTGRAFCATALCVGAVLCCRAAGAAERGRVFDPEKNFLLSVTVGEISPIEGFVDETSRPVFDLTGNEIGNEGAEAYSFAEFGLTESETTFGLSGEALWKWVTLEFSATYMRAEANGVAFRDFFIGVNDVAFAGTDYEYQQIIEGTPYQADLESLLLGLRALITPVTFNPGGQGQFVPWLQVGLFSLAGELSVNAGPALGVIQYENPTRDYVQNGSSKGDAVAFAPEIGLGGELRFQLGQNSERPKELLFRSSYSIFDFRGSTSDLGIGARNEKDIDLDYETFDLCSMLEWPMNEATNFVVGLQFRTIAADALSQAQPKPEEQVVTLREKFDKQINLEMTSTAAFFGFRW